MRSGPENSSDLTITRENSTIPGNLNKIGKQKMALDSENGPAQSYNAPQALAKAWATILIAHLGRLIGPNRCQPFIADQ
jgi:hypothetical protein